jgi:hypothetical protein
MDYDTVELEGRIYDIFHPEPVVGSDGPEYYEMPPHSRLRSEYGLDTSYWRPFEYGSSSDLVRRAYDDEISSVIQAQQVPFELFMGSFRLLGDSIIAYHREKERIGPYRYYPAILMSAWASFEAFVRVYSELLVKTVPSLPAAVRNAILEVEQYIDANGQVLDQRKLRPLLQRCWWFLKFGHGLEYDRGCRVWQIGESALHKRNNLVHYEVSDMPSLTATELWSYLEAILLLLIGPSAQIGVSIMPDQYELYGVLVELRSVVEEFEERPFFKDKPVSASAVIFPCPFKNVNSTKFPTWRGYRWQMPHDQ